MNVGPGVIYDGFQSLSCFVGETSTRSLFFDGRLLLAQNPFERLRQRLGDQMKEWGPV